MEWAACWDLSRANLWYRPQQIPIETQPDRIPSRRHGTSDGQDAKEVVLSCRFKGKFTGDTSKPAWFSGLSNTCPDLSVARFHFRRQAKQTFCQLYSGQTLNCHPIPGFVTIKCKLVLGRDTVWKKLCGFESTHKIPHNRFEQKRLCGFYWHAKNPHNGNFNLMTFGLDNNYRSR